MLPTIGEARRLLAQTLDGSPIDQATAHRATLAVVTPLLQAGRELAAWLSAHEPWGELTLTMHWGETVLIEAADHGHTLPQIDVSRADAEFAARLLTAPAVEWSAEPTENGRRLWVALAVARHVGEATQL
jgi:hypothetical protein